MPKMPIPGAVQSIAPASDDSALLSHAKEYILPSGRRIWWLPPDEMEILAFTGALPDPITAAVYLALREEGALDEKDDPRAYHRELGQLKAEYAILKAGMVKPKFDPDLIIGNDEVLGRRDIPRGDRLYAWNWLFRLGTTPEAFSLPRSDESRRFEIVASDSGNLPPDTSATDGDNGSRAGILHQSSDVASGIESSANA